MDGEFREKLLRIAIMALATGEDHLRTIELDQLADTVRGVLDQCSTELRDMVPDPVPDLLQRQPGKNRFPG